MTFFWILIMPFKIFCMFSIIILFSSLSQADFLFSEDFDDQDDWDVKTTDVTSETPADLPDNWDFVRSNEFWHPDQGEPNSNPSILISGENSDQVFGGTGKAFVSYSESSLVPEDNNFASDGFITKDLTPTNTLYVEFNIKFQNNFANEYPARFDDYDALGIRNKLILAKIFRVLHFDGGSIADRSAFFTSGKNAPIYLYDYGYTEYGLRHVHAFRCDPQASNYNCSTPSIGNDYPRPVVNGDMSVNYTSNLFDFDSSLKIPDLKNGGFLPTSGLVDHDQVWGSTWHKLAFYFQLNSSPGAQDGIFQHWLDDQLIVEMKQIPWISSGNNMDAKWNGVAFGGNDHFHFNIDEDASKSDRERWYSIDNIKIFDKIPTVPNPPKSLLIE
jgi:hypothetical protein